MLLSALFNFIDFNMLTITMISIVNVQRICYVFYFMSSDLCVLLIGGFLLKSEVRYAG